eukprot:4054385-Pyramimonas_sp.AAC.2
MLVGELNSPVAKGLIKGLTSVWSPSTCSWMRRCSSGSGMAQSCSPVSPPCVPFSTPVASTSALLPTSPSSWHTNPRRRAMGGESETPGPRP